METVTLTKKWTLYFRYLSARYITVQSFITIKSQGKRLLQIKILKSLVSDHLKMNENIHVNQHIVSQLECIAEQFSLVTNKFITLTDTGIYKICLTWEQFFRINHIIKFRSKLLVSGFSKFVLVLIL